MNIKMILRILIFLGCMGAAMAQYIDPGQESNLSNVIHAHTHRGQRQFEAVREDPMDPGARNFREFGSIHDEGAENARKAAAYVAENGPTNHATAFIVSPGKPQPLVSTSAIQPAPLTKDTAAMWTQYTDGLFSCSARATIQCTGKGIAYDALDSRTAKWQVSTDRPDWPPTLAGDTVAIIRNSFHTISALSKTTGKHLWSKEVWCSVLASDGEHFYIIRTEYWDLQALDPDSGKVEWSVKLPRDPEGGYPAFLKLHDGLLFTADLVVNISKRAIVHVWPARGSFVTTIGFGKYGNIVVGDSSGMVTAYDRNFKRLWRAYAGKEQVVSLIPAGENILALLYISERNSVSSHNALVLLTPDGRRVWRVGWPAQSQGFTALGDELLVVEPGSQDGKFRLTSRQLSTGKVNWKSASGYLYGWPILCGDTAYVSDGNRLHSFDVHTGAETTARK